MEQSLIFIYPQLQQKKWAGIMNLTNLALFVLKPIISSWWRF